MFKLYFAYTELYHLLLSLVPCYSHPYSELGTGIPPFLHSSHVFCRGPSSIGAVASRFAILALLDHSRGAPGPQFSLCGTVPVYLVLFWFTGELGAGLLGLDRSYKPPWSTLRSSRPHTNSSRAGLSRIALNFVFGIAPFGFLLISSLAESSFAAAALIPA